MKIIQAKHFRERPEEDKCLTNVCHFTFSYCEVNNEGGLSSNISQLAV